MNKITNMDYNELKQFHPKFYELLVNIYGETKEGFNMQDTTINIPEFVHVSLKQTGEYDYEFKIKEFSTILKIKKVQFKEEDSEELIKTFDSKILFNGEKERVKDSDNLDIFIQKFKDLTLSIAKAKKDLHKSFNPENQESLPFTE